MHEPQLLGREGPALSRRRGDEDGDHAFVDGQRDEGGALRAGGPGEPLADEGGRLDVVDRDRGGLEIRARDSRRLVAEAEPHVRPPADVAGGGARNQPTRFASLVVDQRQRRELDAHERDHLVEESAPGGLWLLGPRE